MNMVEKFIITVFDSLRIKPRRSLFDVDFYLNFYPDVARARVDPYSHYLRYGIVENRMPNAWFDTNYYLSQTTDQPIDPTRHYLLKGARLGLNPHPVFDTTWYLQRYPDVANARVNPLEHYLKYGRNEGRETAPRFHRAFGLMNGYSRSAMKARYSHFEFLKSPPASVGSYFENFVLFANVNSERRMMILDALSKATDEDGTRVCIEIPENTGTQPTVVLVFYGCFVRERSTAIEIAFSEVRLFYLDVTSVTFMKAFCSGYFIGQIMSLKNRTVKAVIK